MTRAIGVLIAAIAIFLVSVTATLVQSRLVPSCEEDEVIVGVGDFAGGYWQGYTCVNWQEISHGG